jgi:tetratricopeptide (TPR) repeat protein
LEQKKVGMLARQTGLLLMVAWLLATGFTYAQGDRDELRFLEGLRQRRLFRLAESHCREQLDTAALAANRRAELTLELVRCYAARAVHVPPAESPPFWDMARETAAEFLRQTPNDPHSLLVRVQDALTVLARGELHRQESEVLAEPAEATEAALTALREAARLLQQLDDELAREIPLRHRTPPAPGQLTADQLISLQHNVQFQLARVYRNRALCYPADSEDRLAALTGAVERLEKPLAQITDNDPLIWPIRLDLAVCLRLLGRLPEAEALLQAIEQSEAPAEFRWRAQAERVRLNLDRRQPDQALAVFQSGRPPAGQTAADLDFAYLETCLAQWQSAVARDDAAADTWRNRAAEVVRSIEHAHGPYWGRRGDLLLVRTVGLSRAGGNVDILSRAADGLYRQGQWADAAAAYEQAGAEALAAGQADQGFALRYKAALVEHTRQQHQPASQRLRRLALDLPNQPRAPDVHLLAAWNAAQWARSQPDAIKRYAEILEEHARQWPDSPTADSARLWLGRLRESQGQWQAAAESFQAVSRQHDEHESALRAAARCWNHAFAQRSNGEAPDADVVRTAAAEFWRQTPPGGSEPNRPWTSADRFCAEQAARLLIDFTPDGYAQAETMLRTALDGTPPPDEAWRGRAEPLWIVTLAAQPARRNLAEPQLAALQPRSPDALWQILTGVDNLLTAGASGVRQGADAAADSEARRELAMLQIAVADRLSQRAEPLTADQRTTLQRIRAEALLTADRRDQARAAFAELAARNPDDGPIQQTYAQLLLESDSREDWQQSLDAWRRIAPRQRPGSDAWYEARYAIAAALVKLGDRDEAARRIRYLQALPPGLDGSPWQAKFQQLLDQCNRPSAP